MFALKSKSTGCSCCGQEGDSCKHPVAKTALVLAAAAGALGLYWMWPEIQRYLKMKRM